MLREQRFYTLVEKDRIETQLLICSDAEIIYLRNQNWRNVLVLIESDIIWPTPILDMDRHQRGEKRKKKQKRKRKM